MRPSGECRWWILLFPALLRFHKKRRCRHLCWGDPSLLALFNLPPPPVLSAPISHHKVAGRNLEIPHLRILLLPLYSLFVASVAASFIVFFIPPPFSSSSRAEAPLMEAGVSFQPFTSVFAFWIRGRVFVGFDVYLIVKS